MLRRLLLLPLLSPLLVVLLVGAINPRPSLALRLLTWRSSALPVGLWLSLAGAGGAALSAAGTALALRQGGASSWRRPRLAVEPPPRGSWVDGAEVPGRARREPPEEDAMPPLPETGNAGPTREAGAPAPTVAVPFRVLRRGDAGRNAPGAGRAAASGVATGVAAEVATAATTGMTTAGMAATVAAEEESWDAPAREDW